MEEIPDKSVHLVITSPPYWQLKDYGVENQIGFNDSYENYKRICCQGDNKIC
jgi:site-specific DNA-methyltransferase (adenine-specific)